MFYFASFLFNIGHRNKMKYDQQYEGDALTGFENIASIYRHLLTKELKLVKLSKSLVATGRLFQKKCCH
jgi:hypothetical protein